MKLGAYINSNLHITPTNDADNLILTGLHRVVEVLVSVIDRGRFSV